MEEQKLDLKGLLKEYQYMTIKGVRANLEYDFCSSKFVVRSGFLNGVIYKGSDFQEALDTFLIKNKDCKW